MKEIKKDEKKMERVGTVMPILVKKHIMPVDMVSNKIWKGDAQERTFVTKCANGDDYCVATVGKKEVIIKLACWDEKGVEDGRLKLVGHVLDRYDAAVHDAVCSILLAGNMVFTANMIASVLLGKKEYTPHLSDEQVEEIDRAMENLATTRVVIDASEEAKYLKVKGKPIEGFAYKGYVLPTEKVVAKIGGEEVVSYRFIGPELPPLYRYAARKCQILTDPIKALYVPITNSKENVALMRYLYGEIAAMCNGRGKRNNKILVDSAIEAAGLVKGSDNIDVYRHQKSRLLKQAEKILDYWKDSCHVIEDYEWEVVSRNQKRAIIITPIAENRQK